MPQSPLRGSLAHHDGAPQRHMDAYYQHQGLKWEEFISSQPAMAPPPFSGQLPDFVSWPAPGDVPLPWLPSFEDAPTTDGWSPSAVGMPDTFPFPPPFLPPPPPWQEMMNGHQEFPWLAPQQSQPQQVNEDIRSVSYNANSLDEKTRLKSLADNARREFMQRGRSTSQSSVEVLDQPHPTRSTGLPTEKFVALHRAITSRLTDSEIRHLKEQREARINARRNSVHNPNLQPSAVRTAHRAPTNQEARFRSPTASSMHRTPVKTHHAADVKRRTATPIARHQPPTLRSHSSVGKGITVTALKGEIPSLNKTMRLGQTSERRRLESFIQSEPAIYNSEKPQAPSFVGFGAAQYTPFVELAKKDPRAAEYLRGIETLYTNLRSSYETFQKNPSKFLKEQGPSTNAIHAAVTRHADPTHFSSPHSHDNSVSPVAPAQPSAETRQLRLELDRLEHQWQSLAELRVEAAHLPAEPAQPRIQHPHKQDVFSYENVLSYVKERNH